MDNLIKREIIGDGYDGQNKKIENKCPGSGEISPGLFTYCTTNNIPLKKWMTESYPAAFSFFWLQIIYHSVSQ